MATRLQILQRLVFYLIIIFLPSQLGLHFWPSWSIVNGLRIDYFSPTLYFTDILIILLFLLHPPSFFRSRWFYLVLLFAAVNIYFSLSPFVSLYKWLKVAEFAFLAYWIAKNATKLNIKYLTLSLLAAVFYSSVLAIWQFSLQSSVGGLWYFLGERLFNSLTPGIANAYINGQLILRPYATFPHPNVLGGFLAIILPLIILHFPHNSRRITVSTFLFWATVLLGYAALFLSLSRVAIVIGAVSTVLVFWKQVRAPKRRPYLPLILLIALILLFPRFAAIKLETEPLIVRAEQINLAVTEFIRSPLVGTGLGTSPLYPPARSANYSLAHQPIHNTYLLSLSETGFLGLGLFAVVIYLALKRSPSRASRYALPTLLILGLFDHYFLTLQQGQLLLAILLGLSWSRSSPEW